MPVFPESMSLTDLGFFNQEFSRETIEKHDALYRGGDCFRKIASRFLYQREIEKKHPSEYQKRLARTPFIPNASTIDFIVASVMKEEPRVSGPSYV